jgi:hypothetical protein
MSGLSRREQFHHPESANFNVLDADFVDSPQSQTSAIVRRPNYQVSATDCPKTVPVFKIIADSSTGAGVALDAYLSACKHRPLMALKESMWKFGCVGFVIGAFSQFWTPKPLFTSASGLWVLPTAPLSIGALTVRSIRLPMQGAVEQTFSGDGTGTKPASNQPTYQIPVVPYGNQ